MYEVFQANIGPSMILNWDVVKLFPLGGLELLAYYSPKT